jgi:Domain of unknown function (DUF2024)
MRTCGPNGEDRSDVCFVLAFNRADKLSFGSNLWCADRQLGTSRIQNMKVAVWDTYVTRTDGRVMHFDIIAPAEIKDANLIHGFGKNYLKTKGQEGQPLTSRECSLCHVESVRPEWEEAIRQDGYFVLEMENCV